MNWSMTLWGQESIEQENVFNGLYLSADSRSLLLAPELVVHPQITGFNIKQIILALF